MARKTDLTQKYVQRILDYNKKFGEFRWKYRSDRLKCWNTRFAGKKTGCIGWAGKNKAEYVLLRIDDRLYKAHHVAWVYVTGKWPVEIDHRDLNGVNNKFRNLRECTRSQNQMNRGIQSNNTSGCKGISFSKSNKKWHAYIKINRKRIHIGMFKNIQDAKKAYSIAAKKYHGEFARVA